MTGPATSPRATRRAVVLASAGALAVMLDSAVNIAFPAISAAFGVPVTAIQWVVIAYILPFGAALPGAGRLADRAGHARVLRLGLGTSGVAYVWGGTASTFGGLLAGRALQGVGAALVFGSAPALVTLATVEARRGRALGWFNFAATTGMVLGPLAGGLLVDAWGWRAVFLGRAPLVAATLALAWIGLAGGPAGRDRPASHHHAPAPADRSALVLAHLVNLLANLALFAVWLLVPYYLVEVRGVGVGASGAIFAVCPLAWAAATPLGGRLADRGRARWLPPLGLGLEALGLLLTGRLGAESSLGAIALALALGGAGFGLFVVPSMRHVMGALPDTRQGMAGSLFVLMRTAGVVLGAGVATLVYRSRLAAHGAAGLGALAAGAAFADTFRVTAAIALVAALLSLAPPRRGAPA